MLLRSDFVALRLEGASVALIGERLIPFVREWRSIDDLCMHLSGYDPVAIRGVVDRLLSAGVLVCRSEPPAEPQPADSPWHALLDVIGLPVEAAMARIRKLRIVIVGLEHVGGHVALQLAQLGVGHLALVDPGVIRTGDLLSMPFVDEPRPGLTRQHAIAQLIESRHGPTEVREFPGQVVTKDGVREILGDADFAVGAFDRAFSAAHHWINGGCLETGTPSLYCDLQGVRALVGPMVFPGETPCYMCWRMRRIAAFDDFTEAMAYESAMDKSRSPAAEGRPLFLPLISWAAAVATLEIAKIVLGLGAPRTAGRVLELEALESAMHEHHFLHRPDCPSCRGKLQAVKRGTVHAIDQP